jgi:hypothetical protein
VLAAFEYTFGVAATKASGIAACESLSSSARYTLFRPPIVGMNDARRFRFVVFSAGLQLREMTADLAGSIRLVLLVAAPSSFEGTSSIASGASLRLRD